MNKPPAKLSQQKYKRKQRRMEKKSTENIRKKIIRNYFTKYNINKF